MFVGDDVLITRNIPEFLDTIADLYPEEVRVWLTRLEARKIYPKNDVVHVELTAYIEKTWDYPSRSGKGPGHHVTRDSKGQYNCTCEAGGWGKVCWAIKRSQETYD
jgi:hypothetical protein